MECIGVYKSEVKLDKVIVLKVSPNESDYSHFQDIIKRPPQSVEELFKGSEGLKRAAQSLDDLMATKANKTVRSLMIGGLQTGPDYVRFYTENAGLEVRQNESGDIFLYIFSGKNIGRLAAVNINEIFDGYVLTYGAVCSKQD